MSHISYDSERYLLPALLVPILLALLAPSSGFAQEPKKGAFIDGEYVEDYVYVPDFMSPEELKKRIDEHSTDLVIVDTAAPPIWEEEHIPGAVNLTYTKNLTAPVPLPREKTLVLYCACKDHEDSSDMARQLSLLSYRKVKVLRGGWFKWLDLKYKTVSKEDEKAAK
ncbi:MAG TPA: rhodanese-like domain-containing protein [Bryobacteraceae bacterium]|nr:rhodanese-like domain-containing protein [Bryobacteraceae bacterium]